MRNKTLLNLLTGSASRALALCATFCILFSFAVPSSVFAQDSNPPVDPNGAWGEVIDENGNIQVDNLTDGGVITESADWMPNIPLVGPIDAEYHVYYTPTGNTVVLPTPVTLFFMAQNPQASGLSNASSQVGNGYAILTEVIAGGILPSDLAELGPEFVNSNQFADAVIEGNANIWSLGTGDVLNLMWNLAHLSLEDQNIYNLLLLYTPGQCVAVPGGCTAEQLALLDPPVDDDDDDDDPPTGPVECPAPVVTPGQIVRSSQLIAPNYPLVVGQDPDKRGVDIAVSVSVAPTIRTYWIPEPIVECRPGPNGNGVTNCTRNNGQAGHEKIVGWMCEQHVETYNECVSFATATLRLSSDSRDWILNELSIRYPGAYLHNPNISLGTERSCQVNETFDHIQTADPGYWDITINGRTSGTPISSPRNFSGVAGQFGVWLKEIVIIK